jgi:hypothetical protein
MTTDELTVLYEDLKDELSLMRAAYAGLSFPEHVHDEIKKCGSMQYRNNVPLYGGSMLMSETRCEVNGNLELSIMDSVGSRVWNGVWRPAL